MRRFGSLLVASLAVAACTAVVPSEALAQRRGVRRPPVRTVVVARSYRPVYYRPYYSSVFYSPFYGFGGYGWYGGGYYGSWYAPYGQGYYPGYPYGYYRRDYTGSAHLNVKPREAQVFVDGYFVGTVDDFDGWLQRLNVAPGQHELAIYLDGHRTYREKVLIRPGATLKIDHVMQPLAAGDAPEARPTPAAGTRPPTERTRDEYPPEPRREARPARGERNAVVVGDYGGVAVRVQPMDAEVLVDGERWTAPESGDLTLQLSEGAHRIEVRKDGYRTYAAEVRVRRGETTTLNVSLSK